MKLQYCFVFGMSKENLKNIFGLWEGRQWKIVAFDEWEKSIILNICCFYSNVEHKPLIQQTKSLIFPLLWNHTHNFSYFKVFCHKYNQTNKHGNLSLSHQVSRFINNLIYVQIYREDERSYLWPQGWKTCQLSLS